MNRLINHKLIYLILLFITSNAYSIELDLLGSMNKFDRYVPPLANPLFNETPYITTEVRPIYLHNNIPRDFITNGGTIEVFAAEIRMALTDRLGIIASKDGYAKLRFNEVLPDDQGFANISIGLKYALISDPFTETILTIGAEYEPPSGNLKIGDVVRLQGKGKSGKGFIDLFITGAKQFGRFGLQGSIGTNLALDKDNDSSLLHYSAHMDYEFLPDFYGLVEVNGFETIDHGNRSSFDFDGVDLVNFGSSDGGSIVTASVGFRYTFSSKLRFGIGYEVPVTDREDLLSNRFYVDAVWSY